MPTKNPTKAERLKQHFDVLQTLYELKPKTRGAMGAAIDHAITIGEQGVRPELTDKTYAALKPGQTLSDPRRRGLIMRCGAESGHYWLFRVTDYTGSTRQVEVNMGVYPTLSLADARAMWLELRTLRRTTNTRFSTRDPKTGRHRAIPAYKLLNMDDANVMTVSQLIHKFLNEYCDVKKRASSAKEDRRMLTTAIEPVLGHLPVTKVTGADFRAIIVELHGRAPRSAEKLMTVCVTMWNTAFGRNRRITMVAPWLDPVEVANPMLAAGTLELREVQNRMVDLAEARLFYANAPAALGSYSDAARLQMLCAARISEVTQMAWDEIDLDGGTWTLPAHRAKNNQEHTIYLSTPALDILRQRRLAVTDGQWVFPSEKYPDEAIASDTLSRHIASKRKALGVDPAFRSHDCRHAFTTWAGEQEISIEVRDRCTNHKPSAGRIDAVYNHAQLRKPASLAWQRWADALENKEVDNITRIGARS